MTFTVHSWPHYVTCAEFEAMPLRAGFDETGMRVHHWRELVAGKWWRFYEGTSFGQRVAFRSPIVVSSAAFLGARNEARWRALHSVGVE